jgi:hypothetical protein
MSSTTSPPTTPDATAPGSCQRFPYPVQHDREKDEILAEIAQRIVKVVTTQMAGRLLLRATDDGSYIYDFNTGYGPGFLHLGGDETRGYVIQKWFWLDCEMAELPSQVKQFVWKFAGTRKFFSQLERHEVQATKKRERSEEEEEAAEAEADAGLAEEPVAKKARPTIINADWDSEQAEHAKREEKKIAKYLAIARNHVAAHKGHLTLTMDCIGIPISRARSLELVFRRCHIKAGTKDLRFESWAISPLGGYFKKLPAELKAMRFEVLSLDREKQTAELKLQEE